MTLSLDKLIVRNFGGINGRVELDLSSPLTVIYAPNGTGKTSLIESLNWAFHAGDDEVRKPRCTEAPIDAISSVQLTVRQGSTQRTFERTLDSDEYENRIVDGKEHVNVTDFLRALAPECRVSELAPGTQKVRLVGHLCSNRVLTTKTLSRLIDSNDAIARADAMADLLGTRVQQNYIKQINLYIKKLTERKSSIERDAEEHDKNLTALLQKLSSEVSDIQPLTDGLKALLTLDKIRVGMAGQVQIEEALESQLAAVREQMSLASFLSSQLTAPSPFQKLDALKLATDATVQKHESTAQELAVLTTTLSQLKNEQSSRKTELAWLRKLHSVVKEFAAKVTAAKLAVSVSAIDQQYSDFESRFGNIPSALESLERLEALQLSIKANLSQRADRSTSLNSLKRELASLGDRSMLDANARSVGSQIEAEDRRLKEFQSVAATLAETATRLHASTPNGTACPTCGHDWKSHQSLGGAIERTVSLLDPAVKSGSLALAELRKSLTSVQNSIVRVKQLEEQIKRLESEVRSDNATLEAAIALANRFGFSNFDAIVETDLYKLKTLLEMLLAFTNIVAFDLSDGLGDQGWASDESCVVWLARIQSLGIEMRKATDSAESVLASETERLQRLTQTLSILAQQRSKDELAMSSAQSVVNRIGSALSVLKTSLSDNEIASITGRINQRSQALLEAKSKVQVRRSAIEQQGTQKEIDTLTKLLAPLKKCVAMIGHELNFAASISNKLSDATKSQNDEVFKKLAPTVSQLFQRMQVNRVFESVNIDPEFHITATLGNALVDPRLFSDGQRQDLALSFFLARAYSMSGSFFLDEPLAHLDDVNRVALFDTLRALVLSSASKSTGTQIVLTTASWLTARHIIEKFMRSDSQTSTPLVRVYQLGGNVNLGVTSEVVFPKQARNERISAS